MSRGSPEYRYQPTPSDQSIGPGKGVALSVPLLCYFQNQIYFVGGIWIFFGVVGALAAIVSTVVMVIARPGVPPILEHRLLPLDLLIVGMSIGSVVWITIGVFTCYKVMPAVYTGLILCYLTLGVGIITLNFCSIGIFLATILLAHRVIYIAGKLTRAGIPLNAKPEELQFFN